MTPWDIAGKSEHSQQTAFFAWVHKARFVGPVLAWEQSSYSSQPLCPIPCEILRLVHAIPNGGSRHIASASAMKAEGALSGVWDVCFPCPGKLGVGLYIEFKVGNNYLSAAQEEFGALVSRGGYGTRVVYDWTAAARVIEEHLG